MVKETSPTPIAIQKAHTQEDLEGNMTHDLSPAMHRTNTKDYNSSDIKEANIRLNPTEIPDNITPEDPKSPEDTSVVNTGKSTRIGVTIFGVAMLVVGRIGVPNVETTCVQDNVLNALQFANTFILASGNEIYRDGFQLLCSLMVDFTCLITFLYWIHKGTHYRLPLSLIVFYLVRALVQAMWVSPFTKGYYWETPGLPSLVVPYGRGSDFFFSGHTGFMVICTLEWHRLKMTKVRNFVAFATLYTMMILLVYQIHYSIDVFTGAFFADWAFMKVDRYKEVMAEKIGKVFSKLKWYLGGRFMTEYKNM